MALRILLSLLFACVLSPTLVQAEDWPRFRGPTQAGIAEADNLPTEWGDGQSVSWKTDMPGPGASSPVVFDGRMYVTCYSGYGIDEEEPGDKSKLQRHLVCLDLASGKIIWDKTLAADSKEESDFKGFVALHGFASSTPIVDESGIYVYYGTSGAAAYEMDGTLRWQKVLGTKTHSFGTANSPVLFNDLVIINAGVEADAIIGLKKSNGEEVWRWDGVNRSWNTPTLVEAADRTEMIYSEEGTVRALDPQTGKELWHVQGIDDYICPSVIPVNDIVVAIGARKNAAIAIQPGGSGDVTDTHIVWEINKGSNVSSPTYHDGYLYWCSESKGIAYCADVKTGDIVYEQRMDPRPGRIYASPVVADGNLYYVSRESGTFVLKAAPKYELLAHNEFESDSSVFNASPVVIDNKLYLRSNQAVYCLSK